MTPNGAPGMRPNGSMGDAIGPSVIPLKVEPQPLPTTVDVDVVQLSDGTGAVRVTTYDLGGIKISFYPAKMALQLGEMMLIKAREAETGIAVASRLILPH